MYTVVYVELKEKRFRKIENAVKFVGKNGRTVHSFSVDSKDKKVLLPLLIKYAFANGGLNEATEYYRMLEKEAKCSEKF